MILFVFIFEFNCCKMLGKMLIFFVYCDFLVKMLYKCFFIIDYWCLNMFYEVLFVKINKLLIKLKYIRIC